MGQSSSVSSPCSTRRTTSAKARTHARTHARALAFSHIRRSAWMLACIRLGPHPACDCSMQHTLTPHTRNTGIQVCTLQGCKKLRTRRM